MTAKVIIITGDKGEGKTTFLQEIANKLIAAGIGVSGFTAPASIINGKRNTYNIRDIETGKVMKLCSADKAPGFIKIRSFWFDPHTINYGTAILEKAKSKIIIIDEIGPMELEGKVWNSSFSGLLSKKNTHIIISVRSSLTEEVINHFKICNYCIFCVNDEVNNVIRELSS